MMQTSTYNDQSNTSSNNGNNNNNNMMGLLPNIVLPPLLMNPSQDKINRELFVGNTPPGTSELLILHFCNAAMRRVGLCLPHETPVLNSRVNNKFAFIELITSEMASRALNLNGIPFLNTFLKISRPSKYSGPIIPTQTWQQLTGQSIIVTADGQHVPQTNIDYLLDPEQEKIKRELFIGNTTPEMTELMLREFLGNAIQQVGLATQPGNPITACRVSGKFAFIELRSSEEAANALNLNNIPYLGTALRVGRPSKYTGPPDHHGNWEDILAKYMSGELQLPTANTSTTMDNNNYNNQNTGLGGNNNTYGATSTAVDIGTPSCVVELQHMLKMDDLLNEEEYNDIYEDTKEECSQFGSLLSVVIPKVNEIGATKVFLEYSTIQDATNAITKLQGRTFDSRLVQATYYDEIQFANKQYA